MPTATPCSRLIRHTETGCIDAVYSPNDHGWYAQEFDLPQKRDRVSRNLYASERAVKAAVNRGGSQFWLEWH